MPKLSDAMESGKIIKWLKKEGDRIQGGDILAEVETDKADVEMEAFGAGVLRKILVPAGEPVPIGALIGVIAEPGEDIAGARRFRRRRAARRRGRLRQLRRLRFARSLPRPRLRRGGLGGAASAASRSGAPPSASADAGRAAGGRRRARPAAAGRGRRAGGAGRAGEGVAAGEEDRGAGRRRSRARSRARGRGAASSAATSRRPASSASPAAQCPRSPPGAEFEDVPLSPDPRGDRPADAAVEGAGAALLRHERGRHGSRVGAARAAERARRPAQDLRERPRHPRLRARAAEAPGRERLAPGRGDPRLPPGAHRRSRSRSTTGSSRPSCATATRKPLAPDRRRGARPRRARAEPQASRPGDVRSDVLDLEPRHVRRRRVLGHHQPARGRDPGRRVGPPRAGGGRRRGSASAGG